MSSNSEMTNSADTDQTDFSGTFYSVSVLCARIQLLENTRPIWTTDHTRTKADHDKPSNNLLLYKCFQTIKQQTVKTPIRLLILVHPDLALHCPWQSTRPKTQDQYGQLAIPVKNVDKVSYKFVILPYKLCIGA